MKITQRITPFLWFDDQAEQAAKFYVSVFRKNSRITAVQRYDEHGAQAARRPAGSVMTIAFRLAGQEFVALNGGPLFKFNESVSLVVNCANQKEVDYFWSRLSSGGGGKGHCGWLKDRFGLSWQVVPRDAIKLLEDRDPAKSRRVMAAILKMRKINLAAVRRAHAGR